MEHCETCEFWVCRQTKRVNAKGNCFRYPRSEVKYSNDGCGEHKVRRINAFGGRPQLMKQLKRAGVKIDMKWTVDEMKSKLEEAHEKQKAEATNG